MDLFNSKKIQKKLPIIFTVFILFINTLYVCLGPKITLRQDTGGYSQHADILISHNLSFSEYFSIARGSHPPIMYIAFVVILAILELLLGSYWWIGILCLNLASITMTVYLIFILLRMSTKSNASIIIAFYLSFFSADFLIRSRLILTDTSYMFFAFCVYILLVFAFYFEEPLKRNIYIIGACLLTFLLFFYRPVNVVVAAFLIISILELFIHVKYMNKGLNWIFKRSALVIGVISIVVILSYASIMKNPSHWPFETFSHEITRLSFKCKTGTVVSGRPVFSNRPETHLHNVIDYPDYVLLVFKRMIAYFQISVSKHSISHKILKYLFYIPSYIFGLIGIYYLFRKENGYSKMAFWAGWLAFQWIGFFTLFHALTYVDYTWRFRLPCVPAFIVLAGLGFWQVWESRAQRAGRTNDGGRRSEHSVKAFFS